MESPCRWATIFLLLYLTLNNINVFCQNIPLGRMQPEVSTQPQIADLRREVTQVPSLPSTKAQLMNVLLSLIPGNGLLPDRPPVYQSTLPQEQPQVGQVQNVPKTLNLVPLLTQISCNCEKKPVPIISGPSTVSTNPLPNLVISPASAFSTSMTLQPTLKTDPVSWTYLPKPPLVPSETYAGVQPSRTVWQISQPATEVKSCTQAQPVLAKATPPEFILPISPPSSILPAINIESGSVESISGTNFGTLPVEPLVVTSDSKTGVPINLQINIPPLNDPGPRITIVSAAQPTPTNSIPTFPQFGFPPPPPVIMRRSRSSWRNLLPILLLAMLNDRGCCGGCGCPCNCNCNSDDLIPIPYPIPMPMNNPIVNIESKSAFSSFYERDRFDK